MQSGTAGLQITAQHRDEGKYPARYQVTIYFYVEMVNKVMQM